MILLVCLIIAGLLSGTPTTFGQEEVPLDEIIKFTGDANWAPYHFLNESGEPDGFSVDLIHALCQELDLRCEIELYQTYLRLVTLFLQQHDEFVVVGATSDGGEVLAQAQSLRPQVVVIDLGTPGLTGLETISHLRATMPDVGLIAMSLLSASGYRQAALAAGADDFVPKGALANDLPPAIRRVAQDCRSPERPVGNGGER